MSSVRNKRVLIVEDEYFLAGDLKDELERRGALVVGPFGSVDDAARMIATTPLDCAVVDLNLHGRSGLALLDHLRDNGTPALIVSGYDSEDIETPDAEERLVKPASPTAISSAIETLLARPAR